MLIKYFENQNLTIERYRYNQLLFANPGEVPPDLDEIPLLAQ